MDVQSLIAAIPGTVVPFAGDRALWREHDGLRVAFLPGADGAVLAQCHVFETRAAHLEAISKGTGMPHERVAAALDRFIELGLLQPLEYFVPLAGAQPAPPPPLVAIRTCGRPQSLGSLLDSLRDDERRFSVRRKYLLIDDAIEPAAISGTRMQCERFARETGSDVRLLDAAGRAELLRALDLELGLMPLFDPGKTPSASGARSWNWATLLAAGGSLAMVDDDFRFPLRMPRGAALELDLITEYALETEFFDAASDVEGLPRLEEEPYAWLGRFLGQPSGALLRRCGYSPPSARLRSSASLRCLAAPARVVTVCAGVYGEIPFDSSIHVSTPNRSTLSNLLRQPYRHERCQADNVWQGRRRPHFMGRGVFTPMLIDAREILPPTCTFGKSDDALFHTLLSAADPGALALAVPASIGHFSEQPRDRRARAEQAAIEDINNCLASMVLELGGKIRGADRVSRLNMVGAAMRDLAQSSDEGLSSFHASWRDGLLFGLLQPLHRSLREYGPGAPAPWTEHLKRAISANEAALREREIPAGRLSTLRGAATQMADALVAWPRLWAAGGADLLDHLRPLR